MTFYALHQDPRAELEARSFHDPNSGCQIWAAGVDRDGYGQFSVLKGTSRAHRASWILHFGQIPKGLCVLHKCDTPSCIRPDHLFLGTVRQNNEDRNAKGRTARGHVNGNAALTAAEVLAIRNSPESQVVLGERYGIAPSNVCHIRNGITWAWLKPGRRT